MMLSKMSIFIYLLVACVAIIIAIITYASINQENSAPISPILLKSNYDCGYVYPGETASHKFEIHNKWKKELRIDTIITSCGCTNVVLGKRKLMPNEKTTLDAEVQTKNYPEKRIVEIQAMGKVGNEPIIYKFRIIVEAAHVIELVGVGSSIKFGESSKEKLPLTKNILIRKGGHPLKWYNFECQTVGNNIIANLTEKTPVTWNLELTLSMKQPEIYGGIKDSIEFLFYNKKHELEYKYRIPVEAEIIGPISASPISILFGAVESGEKISKKVKLSPTNQMDSQSIQIESISHTGKNIKTSIFEGTNVKDSYIEVTFLAEGEQGPRSGYIDVKVRDKNGEILTIRIKYLAMIIPSKILFQSTT